MAGRQQRRLMMAALLRRTAVGAVARTARQFGTAVPVAVAVAPVPVLAVRAVAKLSNRSGLLAWRASQRRGLPVGGGARGIVCGRPCAVASKDSDAPAETVAEAAQVADAAEGEAAETAQEIVEAPADAAEDVTSCRAWVQSFQKHDPGDYQAFIPGQEKVALTIDLSPMKLSTLEVGVMRGIVGDRFDPASKKLQLTEESHVTVSENLEAAYMQARMLLGEVRRLAAEMAADPDLPRELLMKNLGGEAWCERTGKWIGESSDTPPSAPVPGVLTLHVGNLPRTMTGEELQKKLAGQVAGPVAVSKKRRDVWARVTLRDDEEQRALVEQALAEVESKYPVRVSNWNY
jgi:hypothetical protein